jgi:hypothetical protein
MLSAKQDDGMYVVKGEPREGGGAIVVTRRAREDALASYRPKLVTAGIGKAAYRGGA